MLVTCPEGETTPMPDNIRALTIITYTVLGVPYCKHRTYYRILPNIPYSNYLGQYIIELVCAFDADTYRVLALRFECGFPTFRLSCAAREGLGSKKMRIGRPSKLRCGTQTRSMSSTGSPMGAAPRALQCLGASVLGFGAMGRYIA